MVFSMTGFGSAEGTVILSDNRQLTWSWELKSVNGRGFDLKLRIPSLLEKEERRFRTILSGKLARGSVYAALKFDSGTTEENLQIDHARLEQILGAIDFIKERTPCAPTAAEGILSLKGVLTYSPFEPGDNDIQILLRETERGLAEAVEKLRQSRKAEGQQLHKVFKQQIAHISSLSSQARAHSEEALPHHLEQMKNRIKEIIEDVLPGDRVEQEAVLLAVKSDIREELDRLDGHILTISKLIEINEAVGRKLDFLAQELGREANTLTSKAWTVEMKQIGMEMKLVVDQFREQVQNIE